MRPAHKVDTHNPMNRVRAILIRKCGLISRYEESSYPNDYGQYLFNKLHITNLLDH